MSIQWKSNPNASIPIKCPTCGHQQTELISRLKNSPTLTCGGCRGLIKIEGAELKAILKAFGG